MKGITWSRDSHGLFDYESRHLTKRTMKTTQATQIIRKTNELELLPTDKEVHEETPSAETKQLLKIINEGGKCIESKYLGWVGLPFFVRSLVNRQIG
jgi:hypothetical protein